MEKKCSHCTPDAATVEHCGHLSKGEQVPTRNLSGRVHHNGLQPRLKSASFGRDSLTPTHDQAASWVAS